MKKIDKLEKEIKNIEKEIKNIEKEIKKKKQIELKIRKDLQKKKDKEKQKLDLAIIKIRKQLKKKKQYEIKIRKQLKKTQDTEIDKAISRKKLRKVSDISPGTVIVYKYKDPKTKDTMEKFDASPLVVVLDTYKKKGESYMLGINLHWITPPKVKKKVFEIIVNNYLKLDWKNTKNLKMIKRRFITLTYDKLKSDSQIAKYILGKGKSSPLRLYLVNRMKMVRLLPIKFFNILFGPQGKNINRSRWSFLSNNHKIKHY